MSEQLPDMPGTQVLEFEVLSPDAARGLTDRIRRSTVAALDALADVDAAVKAAYDGQAWVALGYESWEAYCAAEFSQTRLWSTVDERHARTLALREGGLSGRAIAAVLGVAETTVRRDVSALSGAPNGAPDSARTAGRDGRSYPLVRASSAQVLARQVEVARLRSQGMAQAQVALELGVSQPTVSADEAAMAEAMNALQEDSRSRVQEVLDGHDPVDVEELASAIGVVLAPSTTPGALLLDSARAAVRDLTATAGYLRDGVVFSDTWVQDPRAAAEASVLLLVPLATVIRDLAQALTRLDATQATARDHERATAAAGQAATWLSAWGRR